MCRQMDDRFTKRLIAQVSCPSIVIHYPCTRSEPSFILVNQRVVQSVMFGVIAWRYSSRTVIKICLVIAREYCRNLQICT